MAHLASRRFRRTPRSAGWLSCVVSAAAVLLVAIAVRYVGLADSQLLAAMPFLSAVFLIAFTGGRAPAVVAAVVSSIAFNYLIVPPPAGFSTPSLEEYTLFVAMLGVAAVLGSLTERMHAARERAREWAASERLQKTLLTCISHDLRTPLTAVMGSLSTLLVEGLQLGDAARQELIAIAYHGTQRLDRLMAQLLEMARLEAGAVRLRREPGHLAGALRIACSQLAGGLDGRCRVRLPDDLPMTPMDTTLLSHALANILDNAVKYSPPGAPIDVEARADRDRVVVSIADRGVGVPAEHLYRIFEKFYRLKQPAAAPGTPEGTGLGLAIAKGIVEAHGGRIWAEQRGGGGTVVNLSLPVR